MISYSGFAPDGISAFEVGKQTNMVCMDGLDLDYFLQGKVNLRDVLARKIRRAAESNQAFVPVRELFPEVR